MATIQEYAHRCGWPNCPRMVPLDRWGCREHWHALPNDLRAWIGRAYRHGFETGTHPAHAYLDAHRAAPRSNGYASARPNRNHESTRRPHHTVAEN